ncbi:cytochrome b562 [Vibrio profundi]|uniref:cytochrome b562 n=1 Tax=Vibrio profundi TaxID=1774960 RepID=UPI0037363F3F
MKNRSILLSGLLAASLVAAPVFAKSSELKKNMQEMKLAFKQAAEAQSVEEMQKPIAELDALILGAKQGVYPTEKEALYMEGFKKLSLSIDNIEAQLEQGNLEQAQQELREIDSLRIEYHDRRNPSIWSKIFG